MIKDLIKKGFLLKEQKFYKNALEIFYKALSFNSESIEILFEIAELYFLLGNEEKSINYIEQILKKAPLHIESMILLKKIFITKKDYKSVEQILKNIYSITNSLKILLELLQVLSIQNKFTEIIKICKDYKFDNIDINIELASAYLQINDIFNCKSILEKNLKINNKHQKSLLYLGKIFLLENNKENLKIILEQVNFDIQDADLLNFLGLANFFLKNRVLAQKYFLKAISLDKNNPEYYYNLANLYLYNNNLLAKRYYNISISLKPNCEKYILALANLYYLEKNYKKALELLDLESRDVDLLRISILYEMKYYALAQNIILKIEKKYGTDEKTNFLKSKINEALKLS